MNTGDKPAVIAPPPLIFLGFMLLGLGAEVLWPADFLAERLQYLLGSALFSMGGILVAVCITEFRRAGTNFQTHKPTNALITGGPYRISRNPIYIALSLAYLGIAVVADSGWMVAMLVPALAVIHFGVITREEKYLEAKFGDEYRYYKNTVRRWL